MQFILAAVTSGTKWQTSFVDSNGEAILERPGDLELDRGLVSILALGPERSPKLIGTAFIAGSFGSHAVAISAAHNFHIGVRIAQNPNPLYHSSALREFLPNAEEIDLDRRNLRAIYRNGDRWEFCIIGFLVLDRALDLAVLTLHAQDPADSLFDTQPKFSRVDPRLGDVVGVLGYADMATLEEYRQGGSETATLQRRLVYRTGSVTAIHPDGHILCRGACVQTTIPVFDGMSGGPAFLVSEPGTPIVPFGFISHDPDPEESIAEKNDRSRAGSSIISLLPHEISNELEHKCKIIFRLENAWFMRNTESRLATSVRMHFSLENQS